MKKLILAFAVCGMMAAFTSCGNDTECTCGVKILGSFVDPEKKTIEELQEMYGPDIKKCKDVGETSLGTGYTCK
jgi:hypothetical protein